MSRSVVLPTLIEEVLPDGGIYVFADLVLDYPRARLAKVEQTWSRHRARLPRRTEHRHWDWRSKSGESGFRYIAVRNGDDCEGLLAVKERVWPGFSGPCLYIAYFESAPWNLQTHPDGSRHSGVGRSLFAGAIHMSLTTPAEGAVSLHSLDQSCTLYRHWGMTEHPRDEKFDGLTYFEMPVASAVEYHRRYL